jgi:4-amino-4-deoxy-L-arabinose transferase-like glycosyltransferase
VRRSRELIVLAGILGLAAWLRLRELELVELKFDEAAAIDLARRLLDGTFPTVGLASSVGALNPPLFVYLTAIPLAVDDNPLAATAFVGLLAVLAAALTYAVLRPRFGALAALAACAFFATAPWAVVAGRKVWAQNLLPLVTVALLWTLFVVLERRRTKVVLLVPVLLCLAFQLNFSALALVVPVAAVLAYRARELHWRAAGVGAAVAVVLLAPWLGHEARHGFEDVSKLLSEGRGGGSSAPGAGALEALRQTVNLLGGLNWDYLAGPTEPLLASDAGAAWTLGRAASVVLAVLLLAGLVACAARAVRGARRTTSWPWLELDPAAARAALLLVWLAGAWLSHAFSATDRVFPHYLLVTYPVSFAVAAIGLSDAVGLARGRSRPAVLIAAGGVVAIAACYIAFTLAFHRFLDEHGGTAGDYGVVYREKDALAGAIRERGYRVPEEATLDFLVTGRIHEPLSGERLVTVRDRLRTGGPLPCDGERRAFGPLEACLPG